MYGIKFFGMGTLLFVSHICTLMQGGACWIKFTFFFFFSLNQVSAEINDVMLNPEKASLCFICKGFLGFSTAPKRCRFPDLQY